MRGLGTAVAFDCHDKKATDSMQYWMQKRGIVCARVGPQTLGLRPSLILGPSHAAHLRDAVSSYHVNHDAHEKL